MSLIDLDNLGDNNVTGSTQDAELSGTAGPLAASHTGIEEVYDHYTKKILLCDVSGSMSSSLVGTEDVACWDFTKDSLTTARQRIENAKVRLEKMAEQGALFDELTADLDDEDEDADFDFDEDPDDEDTTNPATKIPVPHALSDENLCTDKAWASMDGMTDEALKGEIVLLGLAEEIGVQRTGRGSSKSKLKVMQDTLRKLVEDRFGKWTDSDIMVVRFAGSASASPAYTREDLLHAITNLDASGWDTNITKAVTTALRLCKKSPSPVNSHHIILVTDGLDSGGSEVVKLVDEMKQLGVVLDVIHITSPHQVFSYDSCAKSLIETCAATGGEYRRVATAKDLSEKVLQAGARLCLPAPAGN